MRNTASRQQSKRLYASHTMIEFIEETHTYLVDGVITPSVTTLIHEIWMPSMYKGINADTLKRAASYGTKVHEMIEKWNKGEETDVDRKSFEGLALRRYQSLAIRTKKVATYLLILLIILPKSAVSFNVYYQNWLYL